MKNVGASFRDPAGFVYTTDRGVVLRQINEAGESDYQQLKDSGLYQKLIGQGLLIPHKEVKRDLAATSAGKLVIQPEPIPFITYPFEWSFSQLQDAAKLTLQIQLLALKHGMSLKDASAYNIQFKSGKPVFIDTLSFEAYQPGKPWQAYRQFCQHFLAPLALMSHTDQNLLQLLRVHLDGVPLPLAAKLLPKRALLRPGLAIHLLMHAKAQERKANSNAKPTAQVAQTSLLAILSSLERTITNLKAPRHATEWGDYYSITNYTKTAADTKAKLVKQLADGLKAKTAVDLGGNNGAYSRVLTDLGIATVCADIDPNAVEQNYRQIRDRKETLMLPMLVDLTNPGGALGWQNHERAAIDERLQSDLTMALALIHHLAISNNLPLEHIAAYLSRFSPYLIIEFVPKADSQVQKLLSTRADIFPHYHEKGFEAAFSQYFKLVKAEPIKGTKRTLYLWKRKK